MRLGMKVLAFLVSLLPAILFETLCELTDGHGYSIAVLHTEDQVLFTMDPTVKCHRCGKQITAETYVKVSQMYADSLVEDA